MISQWGVKQPHPSRHCVPELVNSVIDYATGEHAVPLLGGISSCSRNVLPAKDSSASQVGWGGLGGGRGGESGVVEYGVERPAWVFRAEAEE